LGSGPALGENLLIIGIIVISRVACGRCVAIAYGFRGGVLPQEIFSFGGSIVIIFLASLDE
jgi:hypothetical protein